MTISQQMASVPARILQHPRLSGGTDMGGGGIFEPRSGKWDLRGYRLKKVRSRRLPYLLSHRLSQFIFPDNPSLYSLMLFSQSP